MKRSDLSLFLLLIIAVLSSFSVRVFQTDAHRGIPDDFDPRGTILLVEDAEDDRRSDKLEATMKEKYPYKYEISNKDIRGMRRDPKYADKELYRYILGTKEAVYSYSGGGHSSTSLQYQYCIYDRKTDTEYPTILAGNNFSAASFKHAIEFIVRNIAKLK